MENKNNLVLWGAVVVLALGLAWVVFLKEPKVVVLDSKGNVVNTLGAVSNPRDLGPEIGQNGLQTIVSAGDFKDATTTLASILNPFPATSSVNFIGLFNSGVATSSYNINCGQSTRASAPRVSSNPSSVFWTIENVSTSTIFSQKLLSATTSPVYIGPNEYLQCVAHGISANDSLLVDGGWDDAFRNVQNTFSGSFWVEFRGLIK